MLDNDFDFLCLQVEQVMIIFIDFLGASSASSHL